MWEFLRGVWRGVWGVYTALAVFLAAILAGLTFLSAMAAFGEFNIFSKRYGEIAVEIAAQAAGLADDADALLGFSGLPDVRRISRLDASGAVVSQTGGQDLAPRTLTPPPVAKPLGVREDAVIVAWAPVGAEARDGWIAVEFDMDPINAVREKIKRDHLIAGWVGGAMSIVLLFFFIIRGASALRQAGDLVVTLDDEQGRRIPDYKGPKEIQNLVEGVNALSDRLKARAEEQSAKQPQVFDVFNSISDIVVVVDRKWRIVFANPQCERLTETPCAAMAGASLWEAFPEFVEAFHSSLQSAMDERESISLNGHHPSSDSWFEIRSYPVEDGLALYFLDISEQRRVERDRLGTSERARALFETALDAMITIDADGAIESFNPAAENLFGYEADEVVGKNVNMLMPEPFASEHDGYVRNFIETGVSRIIGRSRELEALRKDGGAFPVELSVNEFRLGDERHFSGVVRDITERKRFEAQLVYLANHDGVTDLANRSLLEDRFEQAAALARRADRRMALLLVGLDRFKVLNDSLGHEAGDRILRLIGDRLEAAIRPGDTLSRWGGDVFAALLADVGALDHPCVMATEVGRSLEDPVVLDGREHFITASIGVAAFPDDGESFHSLLTRAETAMRRAKEDGGDACHFFTDAMDADVKEQLQLESDMRGALKDGQFVVYYQPKVDMASGKVTGSEALVRWNHPERGLVPPVRFIPLAEETGFVVQLGEWVLRESCRQTLAWEKAGGAAMRVAVNVSRRQFREPGFVKMVRSALEEEGFAPERLDLEVTESLMTTDTDMAVEILRELRELGVHLAMDDFGTGYSSLQYLTRFPIDCLKIDRSFVCKLTESREDRAVITSILAMARGMGLSVVAEGVETQDQWRFLEVQGCDEVQGFLVSEPLPADEFHDRFGAGTFD